MVVFGSACITLLSLFFQQVHAGSTTYQVDWSPNNASTAIKDPGPGPELSMTIGTGMPTCYHWIPDFHLNGLPEGIPVYRNDTGAIAYSILPNHQHDRGFFIRDAKNVTLVVAQDEVRTPRCGVKQTYHASTAVDLVLDYKIDPRAALTDRWYMSVTGKDWNQTQFTYYRSRQQNKGTIRFSKDKTFAASFEYTKMQVGDSKTKEKVVMLKIDPSVKLDPSNFIGLWNLVKKRMHRCGV